MTKTVWITRTQPAADESAVAWRAAGFEPLVLPLLEVRAIKHAPLPENEIVIFTSKNGVEHFAGQGQRAVCVGDATAQKARAAGYRDVVSVNGTSADITMWVRENIPTHQAVCHVSGWHIRGTICEDLCALGYSATRLKVYRSFPTDAWPDQRFDLVALYSPLAAEIFADLAKGRDLSDIQAVCISDATAQPLRGLELKGCLIAAMPREDEQILAAQTTSCG
jgi:uroporphyrinogen-III synthase